MGHHSAIIRDEIRVRDTTWMNPEGIMRGEKRSDTARQIPYDSTHEVPRRGEFTETERKRVFAGGSGRGGKRQVTVNRCRVHTGVNAELWGIDSADGYIAV